MKLSLLARFVAIPAALLAAVSFLLPVQASLHPLSSPASQLRLVQDEAGNQTTYEHDKVGNRIEERWPNTNIVTHTYDELNRRKHTHDRLGLVGEWKYDAQGNLETETSGNGHVTTHFYNELNQRFESRAPSAAGLRVLAFGHDRLGNLKTERDANGNETTHLYDKLNRLKRSSDTLGERYAATYDRVGNKKIETDANGFVATHTYDGLNRRTKTTDRLGGVESLVPAGPRPRTGWAESRASSWRRVTTRRATRRAKRTPTAARRSTPTTR